MQNNIGKLTKPTTFFGSLWKDYISILVVLWLKKSEALNKNNQKKIIKD